MSAHLPSPDKFPAELRAIRQWMVYRLVPKAEGGFDKRPIETGWPDSRVAFDAAYARAARASDLRLGFHFTADNDIGGVDLDCCRFPDGAIADWARPVLDRFIGRSYMEISPSRTGIKIIARGCHFQGKTPKPIEVDAPAMPGHRKAGIEIFGTRGFFAMTGETGLTPPEVDRLFLAAPEGWEHMRRLAQVSDASVTTHPDGADGHFGVLAGTPAGMRYFETRILASLNPTMFQDHDQWFRLMCACWHVTAGKGEDAFVRWSTSDPEYATHSRQIRTRWRSLARRRGSPIMVGTLIKLMLNNGAQDIAHDFMSRLGMIEDEAAMEAQQRLVREAAEHEAHG